MPKSRDKCLRCGCSSLFTKTMCEPCALFRREYIRKYRKAHKRKTPSPSVRKCRLCNTECMMDGRTVTCPDCRDIYAPSRRLQTKEQKDNERKYKQRYIDDRKSVEVEIGKGFPKTNMMKLDRLRNRYGISLDEYRHLWHHQDGKCAICSTVFLRASDAHVDHCHSVGKVRGLLCGKCNKAIGSMSDNAEILRAAADYVEFYGA